MKKIRAIRYFEKSIEIYKEIGLDFAVKWMRQKVDFISILRGKKIDFIQDDHNIALKYILNGQKEIGLKIIDKLDPTPETLYMKGIATDDSKYLWESLEGYMKHGDRLYGLYTIQELKRLGAESEQISMKEKPVMDSL
ncbi:hypothetical protein [Jeotgalibacillus marinus]|uniref:Uncharacterized protein n=1 Tax=Jeotgalibacillus marinus TaxID=86667 RepID=A0ABV3Q5B6_9BACL